MKDYRHWVSEKMVQLFSNKIFRFVALLILGYFAVTILFTIGIFAIQAILVIAVLLALGIGVLYLKEKFL
ncbi:MAG: hypothetical protein FH758_09795 [Firmicutes bacterium]|nr:hypothetical protein [Bacillota bacterium]